MQRILVEHDPEMKDIEEFKTPEKEPVQEKIEQKSPVKTRRDSFSIKKNNVVSQNTTSYYNNLQAFNIPKDPNSSPESEFVVTFVRLNNDSSVKKA
jgi:hypothetical protein